MKAVEQEEVAIFVDTDWLQPLNPVESAAPNVNASKLAFVFSIDDGHISDMKMAELLGKHNIAGTFFVPIKNREGRKVLSQAQLEEIGKYFEIGSHTYDHCYLKNVDIIEAHFQITEGKKRLEDMLGTAIAGFCYPGGKYRQQHVDIIQAAGFRYARSTTNLCFDPGNNPFEMQTTMQFYPHCRNTLLRNFARGGAWSNRYDGLNLALKKSDWISRLYALFNWSCEQELQFHLWGHSWEIDELDAWEELERFMAYVATRVPLENRLTVAQLAEKSFSTTHDSVDIFPLPVAAAHHAA